MRERGAGVSANDNESLNKVMETAYRCTLSEPFCVLSRNFLARIVGQFGAGTKHRSQVIVLPIWTVPLNIH